MFYTAYGLHVSQCFYGAGISFKRKTYNRLKNYLRRRATPDSFYWYIYTVICYRAHSTISIADDLNLTVCLTAVKPYTDFVTFHKTTFEN